MLTVLSVFLCKGIQTKRNGDDKAYQVTMQKKWTTHSDVSKNICSWIFHYFTTIGTKFCQTKYSHTLVILKFHSERFLLFFQLWNKCCLSSSCHPQCLPQWHFLVSYPDSIIFLSSYLFCLHQSICSNCCISYPRMLDVTFLLPWLPHLRWSQCSSWICESFNARSRIPSQLSVHHCTTFVFIF